MRRTATARSTASGASVPIRAAFCAVGCQRSLLHRRDELLEQEDVALGHPPARVGERRIGVAHGPVDHPARPLARQRRGAHGPAGDVRRDLREQVVGRAGLAEAARGDDRDRHLVEALQEVQHEPHRRAIGPVHVVDRDQHGTRLGQVREDPEQAVHDGIEAALGLVAGPARGALEQRPGERRRARQQAVVDLVVDAGQQRLEELQRDAELKIALGLRRAGAHHRHAVVARAGDRLLQQRRLAGPGVTLDEQQLTRSGAGGHEQRVDRAQGVLSLEKSSRNGVSSDDWGALRQKTGEPP